MMKQDHYNPFRWNIQKRNALGNLTQGIETDLSAEFITELIQSSARILAFSNESKIYFVGRSPENYFDFLNGIFNDVNEIKNRINLFQFSGRYYELRALKLERIEGLNSLKQYMDTIGLSPEKILCRKIKTTFVDIVFEGNTFEVLFKILEDWTNELKLNWTELKKKIHIVGITIKTHNSPNTWRWQQNVNWIDLIDQSNIKNVSVSDAFWCYIGNTQNKTTDSFSPKRWNDPKIESPVRTRSRKEGLAIALQLFNLGLTKEMKGRLKKELAKQKEVEHKWFRKYLKIVH